MLKHSFHLTEINFEVEFLSENTNFNDFRIKRYFWGRFNSRIGYELYRLLRKVS